MGDGKKWRPIHLLNYRSGYFLSSGLIDRWLKVVLNMNSPFDLIWVNGGEYFRPRHLKKMRAFNVPVLLYQNDDPPSGRDGPRFKSLIQSIPYYDLCSVVRDPNVAEYYHLGAKNVMRNSMSYDELVHRPFENEADIPDEFRCDVSFVGTWMRGEGRCTFLSHLIDKGIPLTIRGARWEKSKNWGRLQSRWGPSVTGRDYVAALQGAKISLGLLSKGNRDTYTTRSVEIPYAGGLLCAERTEDHLKMFKEGIEAVFWRDASECADICRQLLKNPERMRSIREAGKLKVRKLGVGNEDICAAILKEVKSLLSSS